MRQTPSRHIAVYNKLIDEGWRAVAIAQSGIQRMFFRFKQRINDHEFITHCTIEEDGTLINYKEPDLLYEIFVIRSSIPVTYDMWEVTEYQQEPTALAPGNP